MPLYNLPGASPHSALAGLFQLLVIILDMSRENIFKRESSKSCCHTSAMFKVVVGIV